MHVGKNIVIVLNEEPFQNHSVDPVLFPPPLIGTDPENFLNLLLGRGLKRPIEKFQHPCVMFLVWENWHVVHKSFQQKFGDRRSLLPLSWICLLN